MNIREYIKDNILLFDGAMGTYLAPNGEDAACELTNLKEPERVEAIHREYIAAGARAIKTNTFGANRPELGERCAAVIREGVRIAARAAGDAAAVFADIGPISEADDGKLAEEYAFVADVFLACGAKNFLFETNGSDRGLYHAISHIREREPEAFVIVSFAAQPDGFTAEGERYEELILRAAGREDVDAVGLNCVSGAKHMVELVQRLNGTGDKPLSAMPNAGYPTVRGRRTYYDGDPRYFADQLFALRGLGARILGGCCGTTPEHIAAAAQRLEKLHPVRQSEIRKTAPAEVRLTSENAFWAKLCDPKRRPFAVELDSPADADMTRFMTGAETLRDAGADIVTIADCPIARARMDSSLTACKLKRDLGVDALPHMTCRDRNQNATQALLLGLSAEGIQNVLIVTGDPIPSARRDEVKSVYNFNSRKLIRYVSHLNESVLSDPFHIFAALNVNARNFRIQLDLARQKEESGAVGFLTQPVLTARALDNLRQARSVLRGKLLGGIIPVVSQKNALYMNSEIAGIEVDEKIIAAYEGADRERGEALAEEISLAVARAIAPYVDGFYLMTPFGRVALMARIMEKIRQDGLA